jgi:hypothetical protein
MRKDMVSPFGQELSVRRRWGRGGRLASSGRRQAAAGPRTRQLLAWGVLEQQTGS